MSAGRVAAVRIHVDGNDVRQRELAAVRIHVDGNDASLGLRAML